MPRWLSKAGPLWRLALRGRADHAQRRCPLCDGSPAKRTMASQALAHCLKRWPIRTISTVPTWTATRLPLPGLPLILTEDKKTARVTPDFCAQRA